MEVGILNVTIPNELLANVMEVIGNDFKQFVWANRLGIAMPEHIEPFTKSEALMGPILSSSTSELQRMERRGEHYTALELLRPRTGESAAQYCIQTKDLIKEIDLSARIWVEPLEERAGK